MINSKWLVLCDFSVFSRLDDSVEYIVPGEWVTCVPSFFNKDQVIFIDEEIYDDSEIKRQHEEVSSLYVNILELLCEQLNTIHNVNYSCRGWEIIIGPWLKLYIDVLYFRWKILENVIDNGLEGVFIVDEFFLDEDIPSSRKNFVDKVTSQRWNQVVMSMMASAIIKEKGLNIKLIQCGAASCDVSTSDYSERLILKWVAAQIRSWIRGGQKKILEFFSVRFSNEKSILINTPYINIFHQAILALSLRRSAVFYFRKSYVCEEIKIEHDKRICLVEMNAGFECVFSAFVVRLIYYCFPGFYLEGWSGMRAKVNEMRFPKRVSLIYCGSNPDNDDCFRAYIAEQIDYGAKLIISQHGGIYGVSTVPLKGEFVEHRISDLWISWGWSSNKYECVVPGVNIKLLSAPKVSFSRMGRLLLALPAISDSRVRLINKVPHDIVARHVELLSSLDYSIREEVSIRPKPGQVNSKYVREIVSGYLVSRDSTIYHALNKSRLIVCTSYSTTMFESLGINFPTIIILSGYESMFREESEPYMNDLIEAGVLYTDISKAAQKINMIWGDVEAWWMSCHVQSARERFCSRFSSRNEFGIKYLAELIDGKK